MFSEIMQLAGYHRSIGCAGLEPVVSRNQQFAVVCEGAGCFVFCFEAESVEK